MRSARKEKSAGVGATTAENWLGRLLGLRKTGRRPPSGGPPGQPEHPIFMPVYPSHPIVLPPENGDKPERPQPPPNPPSHR